MPFQQNPLDPRLQARGAIVSGLKKFAFGNFSFKDQSEMDIPISTSILGTPVYDNLVIEGGSWQDLNGNVISYEGLRIDTVLVTVTQSKNVVQTEIQGRNGTINELVSLGNYLIEINGALSDNTAVKSNYPDAQMRTFSDIVKAEANITMTSNLLNYFEIDKVIITDFETPQTEGLRNLQLFSMTCISDNDIDLENL